MTETFALPATKQAKGTFCFERQLAIAYAPVRLPCYSMEQAMNLADAVWGQNQSNADKWLTFCITCIASDKTSVVKDYLAE